MAVAMSSDTSAHLSKSGERGIEEMASALRTLEAAISETSNDLLRCYTVRLRAIFDEMYDELKP